MPGVPTYRGCDACRKQKKKCDQKSPSCSRCTRLDLECVGCGKLRYKFKEQVIVDGKPANSTPNQLTRRRNDSNGYAGTPLFLPRNQATSLSRAFVHLCEVTDPKYDLSCYGPWFKDLPRRFGRNEALDAAVDALTHTWPCVHKMEQPKASMIKYGHALQALRNCLNNPVTANQSETLCAVYVLMIFQGWTGRDEDQKMSHGEGMAHLLNAANSRPNMDEFDRKVRDTLMIPVILESIFNPKIRHSAWFQKMSSKAYGPQPPLGGAKNAHLGLGLAIMIRFSEYSRDPFSHISEMKEMYEKMEAQRPVFQQQLSRFEDGGVGVIPGIDIQRNGLAKTHLYYQVSLSLVLASSLLLNGLIRAVESDDIDMVEDAKMLCDEVVKVAEGAAIYRPLGASFVPMCLVPAWAANDDPVYKSKVLRVLNEYKDDFSPATATGWYVMCHWLKGEYDLVRRGLQTSTADDWSNNEWALEMMEGNETLKTGADAWLASGIETFA